MIGARWRVHHAYRFMEGRYVRDAVTEHQLLMRKYQATQLSARQRKRLSKSEPETVQEILEVPDVNPLCDYVYYALRTQHFAEVEKLQKTLQPELRSYLEDYCRDITETGPMEMVDGVKDLP